tara:strand:+ start:102 stop:257 length:156 start_codon:yes stop_codon:yes gene_type:complete
MNNNNTLYDTITGYEITVKDGDFYLVINGNTVKLADNKSILEQYNRKEGVS